MITKKVLVAPNGNLVIHVVGLPTMGELTKAVEVLDVAFHLKVRFSSNVVVGGDLGSIRSVSRREGKDCKPCNKQGLQGSL